MSKKQRNKNRKRRNNQVDLIDELINETDFAKLTIQERFDLIHTICTVQFC